MQNISTLNQSLEEETKSAAAEKEKFIKKMELLAQELGTLKAKVKELTQTLEEKDMLINSLKESVSEQTAAPSDETNLEELQNETKALLQEKDSEIEKLNNLMGESKEESKIEVQQLSEKLKVVEEEKSNLLENFEKIKSEKESLSSDFEMFRKSNANFKEQMASIQVMLKNMEAEKEKVNNLWILYIEFDCLY